MYEEYFGLREKPFSVSPDPRFLFTTKDVEEALACLTFGVNDRRGFIELIGEVGTGKTTLLRVFLDWLLDSHIPVAFIFNPRLDVSEFLDYLMSDFGIECEVRSKGQRLSRLNQWLLRRYRNHATAVVVIDEAQDLSVELLEEVRLLTNLETHTEKLLQIVLCGQSELEEKLRSPKLRQLRQRITLRCRTRPLTLDETREYISSRLATAGGEGKTLFNPEAIQEIYKYSQGIPRLINLLCDHALVAAFVEGQEWVGPSSVRSTACEFDLRPSEPSECPFKDHDFEEQDLGKRTDEASLKDCF